MALIAPSVLAADFSRLGEDIRDADATGIDMFHLDIMDGHFVPNISYGPAIVEVIERTTEKYLDVHLMLSEPGNYSEPFRKAGADNITFHIEVYPDPTEPAKILRNMGIHCGISLNPDTPIDAVLPYLRHFDYLLVMSVHPGFGGQKFIETALSKISVARAYIKEHKLTTKIQVDGGVDADIAPRIVNAGADILVMGTAFFKNHNRRELVDFIHGL